MGKRVLGLLLAVIMICAMLPQISLEANAKDNWKAWAQGDSRWGSIKLGNSSCTMASDGCLITSVAKLMLQSGYVSSDSFNAGTLVTWLNNNNTGSEPSFTAGGGLYWAKPTKMVSGFSLVNHQYGYDNGIAGSSSSCESRIMDLIENNYHIILAVKNYGHYIAVDNAKSLETGRVYIMDTLSGSQNVDVLLVERYSTVADIALYSGWTAEALANLRCEHNYNNVGFCSKCQTEYNWEATYERSCAGIYKVTLSGGVYLRTDKPYAASTAKSELIKKGTQVEVLGSVMNAVGTENHKWYKVSYNGIIGYTSEDNLSFVSHTCDKGTYLYFEAVHPHRDCYECSSCGNVWAVDGTSNYYSSCSECNSQSGSKKPGKPVLKISTDYTDKNPTTFTWASTANTTHYNMWIDKKSSSGQWETHEWLTYIQSGVSRTLPAGDYRLQLQSYNSNAWLDDGSDWMHTLGDYVYLTISCSHSYTSKVTKAATCATTGVRTYTCSKCGASYTETIAATGNHSYSSSVTKAATCGSTGVRTYTCRTCSRSYTETIAATGNHSYGAWVRLVDGTERRYCENCTAYESRIGKYAITINKENGSSPVTEEIVPGSSYTLPTEIPEYLNHNFEGWICDGTTYQPGQTITPTGDMTFTAFWVGWEIDADKYEEYGHTINYPGVGVYFSLIVEEAGTYHFQGLNDSSLDTKLWLYDNNGDLIASDDDSAGAYQFLLERYLEAGAYSVKIAPYRTNATGTLRWSIAPMSGTAGNISWSVSGGTLTLAGAGDMPDYSSSSEVPWSCFAGIIETVVIESGITSIGNFAFSNCRGLVEIEIPDTVWRIGDSAFTSCVSLREIILPENLTHLGIAAFCFCDNLEDVIIPQGITELKMFTFSNCLQLSSIVIPEGVEIIGQFAFQCCENLVSVTVPESVTTINGGAFLGCDRLSQVYYQDSQKQWNAINFGNNNDCLTSAQIHFIELIPEITVQPAGVTVDSGENAYFYVGTTKNVSSYKWQYRKIWKWFDTTMTGYNTDTLAVPATGARNGYEYRCVVTFEDGTVLYSDAAGLTVNTHIEITGHPRNQAVVLGYKGQFTATAVGESIQYQWQYKRPSSELWMDTAMEGATKACVMIETTTARDGYQYRCRITDVAGNEQYTEAATMRVLSITSHPSDASATSGATAQFSVGTSVSEGFTYQWQYSKNGTTWMNTTMNGYNTDTLSVVATTARNGYQYRCVLTGAKNSTIISKVATLSVSNPVVFIAQPEGQTSATGSTVKFSIVAENAQAYQWQYSRSSSGTWTNTSMEGFNTPSLSVPVISSRNGYAYRCVVTGLDGILYYSESATLTVPQESVKITEQPKNQAVVAGGTVEFTVDAVNAVSYVWQYRRSANSNWLNTSMEGYKTATLKVAVTAARNGYQYRCVVGGNDGSKLESTEATLNVITVTTQPNDQRGFVGENVTFNLGLSFVDGVKYQWQYRRSSTGSWTNTAMTGYNTDTLTVDVTASRNAYEYRCICTDAYGNTITSDKAALYVVRITKQPTNQIAAAGTNAMFSITLSDTETISYQWQYRRSSTGAWTNTTMPGYATDTLTVAATAARNGYQYRCIVTGQDGSKIISDVATLTVQ